MVVKINKASIRFGAFVIAIMMVLPAGILISNSPHVSAASDFTSPGMNFDGDLVSEKGALYEVWMEGNVHETYLMFSMSSDNGQTWKAPLKITDSHAVPTDVKMSVENGFVHIAWTDSTFKDQRMYYINSADSGQTWNRPVYLGPGEFPSIDSDGNLVMIATRVGGDLMLHTSRDAGASFETTMPDLGVSCFLPEIIVDGSFALISFKGGSENLADGSHTGLGLYASASHDMGRTWSDAELVTLTAFPIRSIDSRIENNDIIIDWTEEGNFKLSTFTIKGPDMGNSWTSSSPVSVVDLPVPKVEYPGTTEEIRGTKLNKKWTFMVVVGADNSLSGFAMDDIGEMEAVGSTADVDIICLKDQSGAADSELFYINNGGHTNIPLSDVNASWGSEVNTASPYTFSDFAIWGMTNYPADNYGLVLWDHGCGWMTSNNNMADDTSSDHLQLTEFKVGLERIKAFMKTQQGAGEGYGGTRLDLFGYDECLQAHFESIYQAKNSVEVYVGSEASEPGDGWPYDDFLSDLVADPSMTGEELANTIVNRYVASYNGGSQGTNTMATLAAYNVSKYENLLVPAANNFWQTLSGVAGTYNAEIGTARGATENYEEPLFYDLAHFGMNIQAGIADANVQAAAQAMIDNNTLAVINEGHLSMHPNSHGIQFYLPTTGSDAVDGEPYADLDSSLETWLDGFLDDYEIGVDNTNVPPTVGIVNPPDMGTVFKTGFVPVSGTAGDSDGSVVQVEVRVDSNNQWQIATGTTSWTYSWDPTDFAVGMHDIWARSLDDGGFYSDLDHHQVQLVLDPDLPDLVIEDVDVTISNPTPNEGDIVTFGATVHNLGTVDDALNVDIGFYDGNPYGGGSLIDSLQNVGTVVANGGSAYAEVFWDTTGLAGYHDLYAVADPLHAIPELNDANNTGNVWNLPVAGYGVNVECTANTSTVQAGTGHDYAIEVTNTGTLADDITLTIDNPTSWTANFNNNPPSGKSVGGQTDRKATAYRDYNETMAELDGLVASYPSILQSTVLGTTAEGRNIRMIKVSDNVTVDEPEPESLIMGMHHAREWMTVEVVMYYLNNLASNYGTDARTTWMVDNNEIFLIPIVNPDGYEYSRYTDNMWRKNRVDNGDGTYGVDLNRNYDGAQNADPNGDWGGAGASHITSDDTYCGPSAFSEPETQAIRDLVIARDFRTTVSFHTSGQEIYWPWGYDTGVQTPDDVVQSQHAANMAAINGYTPMQSAAAYPTTGDSDDWIYGYSTYVLGRQTFPFTIEMDTEFQPPVSQIESTCALNLDVMYYATKAASDPYLDAPVMTHTPLADTTDLVGPYTVSVDITTPHGLLAGETKMYWKTTGGWNEVVMTNAGGNTWEGDIPGQPDGTWVSYYVETLDTNSRKSSVPEYTPYASNKFFVGNDVVDYTVSLAPLETKTVNLTVEAPFSALPNEFAKISVVATSDNNPIKLDTKETVTTVMPGILLVNDGNAGIANYRAALDNNGYLYDEGTGSTDLSEYRIVIWACDGTSTLQDSEKTALANFLDGGGSVYLNGEDIGYDINADDDTGVIPAPATSFYTDYMHANYVADNSGGTYMDGILGDPISDGMSNYVIQGSYPEQISAADASATSTLLYGDQPGEIAGLKVDTGVYKLVYIGCEYFEGTDAQVNKDLLMYRILEWINPDSPPTVQVTNPNIADSIQSGVVSIGWTANDDLPLPANPIDIYYSDDGGASWTPIASGVANSGTYSWDTSVLTDGVNYLVRVTATDSIGQTGVDESNFVFSVDNTVNDRWHLQIQSAIPGYEDLDMQPVETSINEVYTEITSAGNFQIGGTWLSEPMTANTDVDGNWNFEIHGMVDNPAADGQLYAEVFDYNGALTPLFTTALDDETVGGFIGTYHAFQWTYNAPVATVASGDSIAVQIWLQASTGSGAAPGPNLANADIPVTGTVGGDYTATMSQNDAYEDISEIAGAAATNAYFEDFEGDGTPTFAELGWTLGGASNDWELDTPQGLGTPADPTGAYSGSFSIGNDLTGLGTYPGEYENSLATDSNYIYSPAIDCTGFTSVHLEFQRFLGVETSTYDHAYIEVSTDAVAWNQVYANAATLSETAWGLVDYDISTWADNQATVYIRFELGATDTSVTYCGWNIDDMRVYGDLPSSQMEHKWTIDVPAGGNPYTFYLDAYRTVNAEGDDFIFAYSEDDSTYVDMVTVSATTDTDTYQTYVLPASISGTIYIRVRDADRSAGNTAIDTIYIDHMYIESIVQPPRFYLGFDWENTESFVEPALSGGGPVPTFDIDISATGWSFVSFPIDVSGDVTTLFDDSIYGDGATTWDCIQWFDPTDSLDHWKCYVAAVPGLSDIPTLDNTYGVWIHTTANGGDGVITVGISGSDDASTGINLAAGWNLVGYPANDDSTYTIGDLKSAYPNIDMVQTFGAGPYNIITPPDTYVMQRGEAYWIHATAATLMTVNW